MEERRSICIEDQVLELCLRKSSARKASIKLSLLPGPLLRVDAPLHTPDAEISRLLARRGPWILENLRAMAARPAPAPLRYLPEENHLFLGQDYPLRIVAEKGGRGLGRAELRDGNIRLRLNLPDYDPLKPEHADSARKVLQKWYTEQAAAYFSEYLGQQAENIDWLDKAPDFTLRSMHRRWASCSSRGNLVINRHLIKAPPECVAYVLLHELCHLREFNHSPQFYALLTNLDPDWKAQRALLNSLASKIVNV